MPLSPFLFPSQTCFRRLNSFLSVVLCYVAILATQIVLMVWRSIQYAATKKPMWSVGTMVLPMGRFSKYFWHPTVLMPVRYRTQVLSSISKYKSALAVASISIRIHPTSRKSDNGQCCQRVQTLAELRRESGNQLRWNVVIWILYRDRAQVGWQVFRGLHLQT